MIKHISKTPFPENKLAQEREIRCTEYLLWARMRTMHIFLFISSSKQAYIIKGNCEGWRGSTACLGPQVIKDRAKIWIQFSLVAQTVKNLPAMQETWVQSLGWDDALEKGMATYSSILAWRIPWTEEPGRPQSMGSQRVGHNWPTNTITFTVVWPPNISALQCVKLHLVSLLQLLL